MRDWLGRLARRLGRTLAGRQILGLESRVSRLEEALAKAKLKNEELARQLQLQREKTRELYAKTVDFAERLNRR